MNISDLSHANAQDVADFLNFYSRDCDIEQLQAALFNAMSRIVSLEKKLEQLAHMVNSCST